MTILKNYLLTALVLLISLVSKAQQPVSGIIYSSDGKPAGGVNLELKDLKKFTISDSAGHFEFTNIAAGSYQLVASFAGLQTKSQFVQFSVSQPAPVIITLEEDSRELQEVIVASKKTINNQPLTVGKVSIDPMDLPQSITVVGQSTIKDQQAQRLSDVVRNVNGVYLAGARASTQETFYARGYNFSSNNMFKNGSRVNTGSFPEMSSLEKVEVLKGSAAILYGNVAPGGIINMVTKQPRFTAGGEVSLRAGSYGLLKPAVDFYGPLSKKVAYRINGTYEKADSYRASVSSERFYINPSILVKFNQKTSLLLHGDYLNHGFTPDFGIGSIADTLIPNVSRSAFMGTQWQYNDVAQATASANLKHAFNDNWNLVANLSYQNYSRDYYGVERIQAKQNGDWSRPLGKINSKENYYIANVDLTGRFKTGSVNHTLLAGLDADRYNTTAYSYDIAGKIYDTFNILNPSKFIQRADIPVATALTRTTTPVTRAGFYVQDLLHLSDKLKLLAGVRWSMQQS
ncbi:MAG: TonB-dependent receptor, partial [Chitinophagaceae bacterium]